ncbi:MAG TPA: sigma-70 family RNA polymerase sigma factor [Longimicrobiales bacterium]|nr:sigma-70 family RNA polymerase sigma factor [Longimicrobiales bacterium]
MRPVDIGGESDARLVRRAREGDGSSFEILVRRYLNMAYAVALAELADARDAEDAVQDSFITALERLDECRDPAAFAGWLRRIVRNRARSVRRREKIRETDSLESAGSAATPRDPGGDLSRSELRRSLQAALGTLTEVQRRVVLMHDLEGYRHREIALELDIPEGTVRSHLFFARRALREQLGDAGNRGQSDG